MKATVSNSKPVGFVPVSITLTFESQRELDAFGAIHNFTAISDSFAILSGKKIDYTERCSISVAVEKAGGNIHSGIGRLGDLIRGHAGIKK